MVSLEARYHGLIDVPINRFLRPEFFLWKVSTEYGTIPEGSDPEKGVISKLVNSLVPAEMTDNDACAVYFYGEGSKRRLIAHTETCLLREVNPDTLDSMPDKIDMSSVVNILRYARKLNKAERSAKQVLVPSVGLDFLWATDFIEHTTYLRY